MRVGHTGCMNKFTRRHALQLAAGFVALPALAQSGRRAEAIRRIPAVEAGQGVAADERYLYAITNYVIGKYDKRTGERVGGWQCERGQPLIHLDGGVVHDGVLWCSHSNFPGVPMTSSIETWDAATMEHAGSYSFGIRSGSATWIDFYEGFRYVTFAHYRQRVRADESDRDPSWTELIQFDAEWNRRQAWVYPANLIAKLGGFSLSGGVFTREGKMWCSGHDNTEVYVLSFPTGGSTLVWEETIPMPMPGQGIALDPEDPTLLYGIDRPTKEIVVTRVG
jgi:hypothetical protein